MGEKEAAVHLGVSLRTLHRYRSRGILPYRESKGKTRPVIEYARADIDRLKSELDAKRQPGTKSMGKLVTTRRRVTFGLQQTEHDALSVEGEKYGMTPGEYARRLTRDGMESKFREESELLHAELGKANVEIKRIRKEFSSAFEVILEYVGLSPEDAKKWVTDNLR